MNAAWYEDPSYPERVAEHGWNKLLDEYLEWLGKEREESECPRFGRD